MAPIVDRWPRLSIVSLLTGRMDEFIALPGTASHPSRRFGRYL
jgi:hypothetical protein